MHSSMLFIYAAILYNCLAADLWCAITHANASRALKVHVGRSRCFLLYFIPFSLYRTRWTFVMPASPIDPSGGRVEMADRDGRRLWSKLHKLFLRYVSNFDQSCSSFGLFFFRFLFPISDERMGIKDYGCMYIDSAIRMEGSGRRYRAVGICEVNLFNVKCVSVSSIGLKSASYTNPNRSRSTVSRSPLLTDVYHFSWPGRWYLAISTVSLSHFKPSLKPASN
jgi:hypothetical protein